MEELGKGGQPATFQAAASTVECEHVADYVTLVMRGDWSARCSWYSEYKEPENKGKKRRRFGKKAKERIRACRGPECAYVTGYRQRLRQEEQVRLSEGKA